MYDTCSPKYHETVAKPNSRSMIAVIKCCPTKNQLLQT